MLRGLDVENLTPTGLEVLGLLGARYIVMDEGTAAPGGAGFEALTYAYRGSDATVLENDLAVPRALVARRVVVARGDRQELAAVATPGFDARHDAIVRRAELGRTAFASDSGAAGTVDVVGERNAQVMLRAHLARRALVVLDDAWAPGWSVSIDGRPARALRADVVMRGVVVPAGVHRIVWSYRVPDLRAGALLSVAGLLLLFAWAAVLLVRSVRATLERLRP